MTRNNLRCLVSADLCAWVAGAIELKVRSLAWEAPIGLKEDELKHYLIDLKIDAGKPRSRANDGETFQPDKKVRALEKVEVSQYGQNGAKTLKEFSEELIKGDVRIVKDKQLWQHEAVLPDFCYSSAAMLFQGMVLATWSQRHPVCR